MAKREEPCVWFSNSHIDTRLLFGFTWDVDRAGRPVDDLARAKLVEAVQNGDLVEADAMPPAMWIKRQYKSDDRRTLPPLSSPAGALAISQAFADVLSRFDLGKTRFYPVELFKSNRTDRFAGTYYLLNIAEVHRYFSPEHSARFRALGEGHGSYIGAVMGEPQDGDISVDPAALEGPDLRWTRLVRPFGGLAKVDRVCFTPPIAPSFVP